MSFVLPIAEMASAVVGVVIAYSGSKVFNLLPAKGKRSKGSVLLEELEQSEEWRHFLENRLNAILEDRSISDTEWKEILAELEKASSELVQAQNTQSASKDFLARSERSKKLVASDMIQHIYG